MSVITNKVRDVLKFCGIVVEKDAKVRLKAKLLFILSVYIFVQTIFMLNKHWDSIPKRFLAIEDLNLQWLLIAGLLWCITFPEKLKTLLEISETDYHRHIPSELNVSKQDLFSSDKNELKNKMEADGQLIVNRLEVAMIIGYVSHVTPNILTAAYLYFTTDISVDEYPLPIEFYNIFTETMSIKLYLTIYIIQSYCYIVFCAVAFLTVTVPVIYINHIVMEMKLLILSLTELNRDYNKTINLFNYNLNNLNFCFPQPYEIIIKHRLEDIVKHHQFINSKVARLSTLSGSQTMMLNQACCVQLCMSLCEFQGGTLESQIKQIFTVLICLFYLYLKCSFGQKVIDTGEELRETLYNSVWYEKPKWYKIYLYLMMTRTNRIPEVKPFGIYVENMRVFTTMLQASYSYFNFLRNFT